MPIGVVLVVTVWSGGDSVPIGVVLVVAVWFGGDCVPVDVVLPLPHHLGFRSPPGHSRRQLGAEQV